MLLNDAGSDELPKAALNRSTKLPIIAIDHLTYRINDTMAVETSWMQNKLVFENEALVELIQLKTLDEYCKDNAIEQIDFMKMDVEGNELKVLQGAKDIWANDTVRR